MAALMSSLAALLPVERPEVARSRSAEWLSRRQSDLHDLLHEPFRPTNRWSVIATCRWASFLRHVELPLARVELAELRRSRYRSAGYFSLGMKRDVPNMANR